MLLRSTAKRSRRAHDRWLDRDDWMRAGQALLVKEGIAGMRLSKLTKKLKVSTGSFYHHFTDMESYLGELADYYNTGMVEGAIERATNASQDPLEQIRALAEESRSSGLFELDAAMRVWGASDRKAAVAMQRSETVVLSFLAQCFSRLGFDASDSDLRARILLSVNVIDFTPAANRDSAHFRDETLRLLLGDKVGAVARSARPRAAKAAAQAPAASDEAAPAAPRRRRKAAD